MMPFYGVLGDYLTQSLKQPISINGLISMFYGIGFGSAILFESLVNRINGEKPLTIFFVHNFFFVFSFSFV